MNNFASGDLVKFKDELWEEKKAIGMGGGLFGPPLPENPNNSFIVSWTEIQNAYKGDAGVEVCLEKYGWLCYADELEKIEIKKISPEQLQQFAQKYYSGKNSTYKHLRFGQAFMNELYPNIPEFCDIYYGENDKKVVSLIIEHFVELERETLLDVLWKG